MTNQTDHSRFDDIFGNQNEDGYEAKRESKVNEAMAESNQMPQEELYEDVEILEMETGKTYIESHRIEESPEPSNVAKAKRYAAHRINVESRQENKPAVKNAPTKKVEKHLDGGLYLNLGGDDTVIAAENDPCEYFELDENGNPCTRYQPRTYTMSWYVNQHLHSTDEFATVQKLANAMRDFRSLDQWLWKSEEQ